MNQDFWYVMHLNAEPWAIGPLDLGRRNGKLFPRIGPNHQLLSFQEAVREDLSQYVEALPEGEYELTFYIWRNIEEYQGDKKKVRKNRVDATNLQKALEDALQGILFDNDRAVRDVRTVVVVQDGGVRPRIAVRAALWNGLNPDDIPQFVWDKLDAGSEAQESQISLWNDGDGSDIF